MIKVRRALISVSDKAGLSEFAKTLHKLGVVLISTGGTASLLRSCGLPVTEVSAYTGFPELLDGRVKTLHPKIHAGLLAVRDNPKHMEELEKQGIEPIDMVVVNLYPFEKTAVKKNASLEECIEHIDIGGPSMLRSAAKNYKSVAVICNPARYAEIAKELVNNSGILSDTVLAKLAVEVFERTAAYDGAISNFLSGRFKTENPFSAFPNDLGLQFTKVKDLRYGENPHQQAALYCEGKASASLAALNQLQGKELSFNNILDVQAAVDLVRVLDGPGAVIVKHNNPSGIAEDPLLERAYRKAFQCDPLSAFGGVIGVNRPLDSKTAQAIIKSGFMECIVAPEFSEGALKVLKDRKNLRLLQLDLQALSVENVDYKKITGGLLLQEKDNRVLNPDDIKIVSKLKPTKAQMDAMLFGWKFIKHVQSNAIVLIKGRETVGVGAGLTSRVDAAIHAIRKAGKKAKGAVLISDAFLPKADTLTLAAKAGVKAIIQTGGSIADEEIIQAANKHKMAMAFTGLRHFKH